MPCQSCDFCERGKRGKKGKHGKKGQQGDQGPKGDPGTPAIVSTDRFSFFSDAPFVLQPIESTLSTSNVFTWVPTQPQLVGGFSLGTFTASRTGTYTFYLSVQVTTLSPDAEILFITFQINGVDTVYASSPLVFCLQPPLSINHTVSCSTLLYLTASNTVTFRLLNANATLMTLGHALLTGFQAD